MNESESVRNAVEADFGLTGSLSKIFPNYTPRPQQIAAAEAITAALESVELGEDATESAEVCVEAGTGVGKSLSYLIPLARRLSREKASALVVTSGLDLLDQIQTKDWPLVSKIYPRVKLATLKGIANYACLAALDDPDATGLNRDGAAQLKQIAKWAETSATGDRRELLTEPEPAVWSRCSVSSWECSGRHCRCANACHYMIAKRRAADSQIVVVNYHLLLQWPEETIAKYKYIVCDEAHELPAIARRSLGGEYRAATVAKAAGRAGTTLRTRLLKASAAMVRELEQSVGKGSGRIVRRHSLNHGPVLAAIEQAVTALRRPAASLEEEHRDHQAVRELQDAASLLIAAHELSDDGVVYYVEGGAVRAAVLSPGPLLKRKVWSKVRVKAFLSATLTTDGDAPFRFFQQDAGISQDATTLRVDSPFDYPGRVRMYLPRLVSPKEQGWARVAAKEVAELVAHAAGPALCLHTNTQVMRMCAEAVAARCAGREVLVQGQVPKAKIVERLRAGGPVVAHGVASLWTGVDAPGMDLLIIDRLPYGMPEDPIEEAIKERLGGAYFNVYLYPAAIMRMRQGFGRLMRRGSDRGLVTVLDSRFHGSRFDRAMPSGIKKTASRDTAAAYLKEIATTA